MQTICFPDSNQRTVPIIAQNRVLDDLLSSNDDSKLSVLTLLDRGAAFDTTEQDILHH